MFLQFIDLSHNKLESVEPGSLDNLPPTLSLLLHSNPWKCDCYLLYLQQWLLSNEKSIVTCQSPGYFRDDVLSDVPQTSLTCDTRLVK